MQFPPYRPSPLSSPRPGGDKEPLGLAETQTMTERLLTIYIPGNKTNVASKALLLMKTAEMPLV